MSRKEFRVGDLFERVSLPRKIKKFKKTRDVSTTKSKEYDLPLVNSKVGNNGIMYYGDSSKWNSTNLAIDIIQDGAVGAGMVYAHPDKVGCLYNAYLIRWKNPADNITNRIVLYLAGCLRKSLYTQFSYSRKATWDRVQDAVISLPVTPAGQPDFAYMTARIRELEAQRIRELEAYLQVTGLDDTTLSEDEIKALKHGGGQVSWKKFKIGDVFEKPGKGDIDLQNDDINGKGEYFINSGETNLGIKGRTSREAKVFPKNTITIDFFGNAYYRDFPYKLATHNHVFSFQSDLIKSREVCLYLVGALGYLKKKFSYHDMLTWNKLKKLDIQLPVTSTGDVDFDYMQTYIRALEKQTIKGVVEYKDKVIQETKKVVNG